MSHLQRGDRRGQLTYLGPALTPKFLRDPPGAFGWFHCTCGNVKRIRRTAVVTGRTSACGCRRQVGIRKIHRASVREAQAKRRTGVRW